MVFTQYKTTEGFRKAAWETLRRSEVQNNIILGYTSDDVDTAERGWLLAAVCADGGEVLLAAGYTPPFNVVLYEPDNIPNDAALEFFARELRITGVNPPGVTAERGTAERFARAYAGDGGYTRHFGMNLMLANSVELKAAVSGFGRAAAERDLHFLPYWYTEFERDCGLTVRLSLKQHEEQVRELIRRGKLFVWEDGGVPVSTAASPREVGNGSVISEVYTPPFYRNRGYGAAAVAYAASACFDAGAEFCCLFADADNPVSNGIYKKLGFRDIGIVDELQF
ncbi:MAG: GNAT family N-acetyltransferase [Oscillospiraceae bacterium]|jgi:predicted GNAT family acetyltransferase|nr:GNAT family N-acetyltransferase [Oscillospiraceae bacterium]